MKIENEEKSPLVGKTVKYEINLPTGLLLAVSQAASNEQTRYYLSGVNIEPSGEGAIMVATDRRIMMAAVARAAWPDGMPSFILPIEMVKALPAADKRLPSLRLILQDVPCGDTTKLQIQLGNMIGQPVDGSFPTWRRVLSGAYDVAQNATIAAGLVAKVARAQKLAGYAEQLQLFGGKGGPYYVPFVRLEKDKPVVAGDIFAVVMPIRPSHTPGTVALPSWVNA